MWVEIAGWPRWKQLAYVALAAVAAAVAAGLLYWTTTSGFTGGG